MKKQYNLLLMVIFLLPELAHSAELLVPSGGGIEFANGKLRPNFSLKETYTDNLTYAPSNKIDAFGTLINTGVKYELKGSKNRVTAGYSLAAGLYDEDRDDYLDNKFNLSYRYAPTSRIAVGIRGEYLDTQDARGTFASEGPTVNRDPDEWHQYKVESDFTYGAKGAKGNVSMNLGYVDKTYDNNRANTIFRDRENIYLSSRFSYKVLPKTSLVLQGRVNQIDYDQDNTLNNRGSLDSVNFSALAGVAWNATAKTTGEAKIGYNKKVFDSSQRDDTGNFSWEVGVQWRPKSYSVFNLVSKQSFEEPNGIGDVIDRGQIQLNWSHQWLPKVGTDVKLSYAKDDFEQAINPRSDDIFGFGVSANYKFRRWLTLGVSYDYKKRDSNIRNFGYEVNQASIFTGVNF